MRPVFRRALSAAAFVVIAGCYLAPLVLAAGGCAVGRTLDDDSPMVGFPVGPPSPESIAAARQTGATAGGAIGGMFGPGGAAVGSIVGDQLGYLLGLFGIGAWAQRRGERRGWDEAVGTPAQSRPAVAAGGGGGGAAAAEAAGVSR